MYYIHPENLFYLKLSAAALTYLAWVLYRGVKLHRLAAKNCPDKIPLDISYYGLDSRKFKHIDDELVKRKFRQYRAEKLVLFIFLFIYVNYEQSRIPDIPNIPEILIPIHDQPPNMTGMTRGTTLEFR